MSALKIVYNVNMKFSFLVPSFEPVRRHSLPELLGGGWVGGVKEKLLRFSGSHMLSGAANLKEYLSPWSLLSRLEIGQAMGLFGITGKKNKWK